MGGTDIHTDCNSWKTSGQCEDNPKDTMNDCPGWAQSGECDANPSHTLANCPLSCGSCATGACKDTNATACAVWAVAGQCQETPAYMAQEGQCEKNSEHMLITCPQSCGLCSRLEKFYI